MKLEAKFLVADGELIGMYNPHKNPWFQSSAQIFTRPVPSSLRCERTRTSLFRQTKPFKQLTMHLASADKMLLCRGYF